MTQVGWPDLVGIAGVTIIVIAYLGLQLERLDGRSLAYSVANTIGSALVLASLCASFNLSAFVIETFWGLISLYGIVQALRRRPAAR